MIYDRPVRELLKEYARDRMQPGRPVTRLEIVAWFQKDYPLIKKGTVNAHVVMMSANAPTRVHYKARSDGSDDVFYRVDPTHVRLYDPTQDPPAIYTHDDAKSRDRSSGTDRVDEDEEDSVAPVSDSTFAYERDLRDYLARNLTLLEPALRLYKDTESEITGIEFPVGGRFADILAVDGSGGLVVIELKVSRGYDRVIGQVLRYMGWIASNLAEPPQQVRGIIVANHISEDLVLACSRIEGVSLFEYRLAVTVHEVRR